MQDVAPRADQDAERAIIGTALMEPRTLDLINLDPADMYEPRHEGLWRLMRDEQRSGRPTDPISIIQALTGHPVASVDAAYIHQCVNAATVPEAAEHYASIVTGLAALRRLHQTGLRIQQAAQTGDWASAGQTIDNARAELDQNANATTGIKDRLFAQALADAIEAWDSPAPISHRTGWADLDQKLNGGWKPGQLTVIGARPAVGKSVVAGCAAVAANSYGAGFFSLEMREEEVIARMTAAAEGIQLSHLNSNGLDEGDWQRVSNLVYRSSQWPIHLSDESRLSMTDIRAYVRTWNRAGHVPLIIIDYLQLVQPADRSEQRERQVSRIAEDCKHLAKEMNAHVIALAQVNRASTSRADTRPTMSDLRESGGIEAFADNIILLHRDDEQMGGEIEFIIAKNRHGSTGTIRLAWRPNFASVNGLALDPADARHGMEPKHATHV